MLLLLLNDPVNHLRALGLSFSDVGEKESGRLTCILVDEVKFQGFYES